jgi:hypothetical protein
MRRLEHSVLKFWEKADKGRQTVLPHEFFYADPQVRRTGAVLPD